MSESKCGGDPRDPSGTRRHRSADSTEIQRAMARLEAAVQQLVASARTEFSGRAAGFINETARRLEREAAGRGDEADNPRVGTNPGTRNQPWRLRSDARRSRRLCRDREHQKIGGVCAGIAAYYGLETWVVRCVAVTGLIFMPQIVLPGYCIAYFLMDRPPRRPIAGDGGGGSPDHSSPAPEFGTRLSPRRSLRNVQADLAQVELKLRRIETHVTSGQYELQRELARIEAAQTPSPR